MPAIHSSGLHAAALSRQQAENDSNSNTSCFRFLLNCIFCKNNNQAPAEFYSLPGATVIDGIHLNADPVNEANFLTTLRQIEKTMISETEKRELEGRGKPVFFLAYDFDKTIKQPGGDDPAIPVGLHSKEQQKEAAEKLFRINQQAAFAFVLSCRFGLPPCNGDVLDFLKTYEFLPAFSSEALFTPQETRTGFPASTYTFDYPGLDIPVTTNYQDGIFFDPHAEHKGYIICEITRAYSARHGIDAKNIVVLFIDDTPNEHKCVEKIIQTDPQEITCISIYTTRPQDPIILSAYERYERDKAADEASMPDSSLA